MSLARSVLPRAIARAAPICVRSSARLAPAAAARALSTFSPARPTRAASASASSAQRSSTSTRSNPSFAQRRHLSSETRTKLEKLVSASPLVLFMKGTPDMPMCGFSRAVVQILDVQGVNLQRIKAVNVLEDEEVRQGIKEFTDWPTIPQLYVQGEFVGGCDILLNMHKSGELEDLLVKHSLVTPSTADKS
ncbi:monothiol glutaredoxin grx5 [Tilletia horrida]|uniref:Monothiol glutaredoxin-5, mitochondrial n=1 Tax=Tilletia horrida TaxID=155126 RepID=A0AAN6G8R0_9BASI|nr:monothiol glutaredoxin grx5 [Tilletia horrida]KAK0526441.1 monothiol glutaredoxin grx5 [Tilletia horrida]KAK0538097.1 monothiol glutaredoxin grx5 [Tilletia horrida]KAK0561761.1 monothiol glutaredoxin grx5 [Tilletia horrida]